MAKPEENTAPDNEEAEASETGRRLDPELRVMGAMLRMLSELDGDARRRVVTYLADRFPNVCIRELP